MNSFVAVTKGKPKEATIRALKILRPSMTGSNILIKPNIASLAKNNGENTGVLVAEGLVEYLQGSGDIIIAEGCCGAEDLTPASTYKLFESHGYSELEGKYGIKLFDLNKDKFVKVRLYDKELGVSKAALDSDYLISLPVLKTHEFTTISACVKNLMGCLQPKLEAGHETATKWQIHSEISEGDFSGNLSGYLSCLNRFELRLIDLYKKLSPKLGIIDAIVASEGNAPINGTPVQMGLILASENPISCDAVAAYLMGIDPATIGYLKAAVARNLGEIRIKEIKTNVDLQSHVKRFKLPSFIEYLRSSKGLINKIHDTYIN